jgi:hypothetical protein
MLAEMSAAMELSRQRSDPLSPEDVWLMATSESADSIWLVGDWEIAPTKAPPLILLPWGGSLDATILGDSSPVTFLDAGRLSDVGHD